MAKMSVFSGCLLSLWAGLGCGGAERFEPGGPTKVVMWMFGGVPAQQVWYRQAVEVFNASRSDIQIEYENRDWATQRESLITTTIVGEGPDIIHVHHKYSVEFGELGGLYALDNFADFPQIHDRILPNVWEHVSFEGRPYGLPITMLPFILAVNKGLLAEHDLEVPRTWEDIQAMGPVLKKAGVHAFTMPAGLNQDTAYRFLPLLYKAGGRVFNQDWSRAAFNGPAGVAALEFLVGLKADGFMPRACGAYAFGENAIHWCAEKAALSIEGPWWQDIVVGDYQFDLDDLQLVILPGPAQPPGPHPPRTLLDVVMVAITGYTPVPDEAWTVVKALFVDDPVWTVPNPSMAGLPTHKAAYGPGVESKFIDLDILEAAGRNGLAWPGHPAVTEIQRYIADAVNTALTGTLSPQEALDQAAADVDEILEDF